MKRSISPFGNSSIRLRLVEERDLATTLTWRNRDEARVWFKTSDPLTMEQHVGWFKRYQEKDDDFLFVVEADGQLVGQAAVYGIDWSEGTAEVGRFLVAPEASGRGLIGQACQALVECCEKTLELSYLFLEVFENNQRAIRVYDRTAFVEESRYDGLIKMGRKLGRRPHEPTRDHDA
jgi:diamine N-acetyltransferase